MRVILAKSTEEKAQIRAIKNPLLYTLAVQLLVVLPVLVVLLLVNPLWMTSFLLGVVVYSVPNAYFTYYAFRYRGIDQSQEIARSFHTGEFGKLALAAVGFALVHRYIAPLHSPSLLAGFGVLIVVQWYIAYQVALHYRV